MSEFRKKPVVIEARQLGHDYDEDCAIMAWCRGKPCEYDESCALFTIETLEGWLTAREGDWIIKGVKGEFYPCKPDIFDATYEPAAAVSEAPQEALAALVAEIERLVTKYRSDAQDVGWLPLSQFAPVFEKLAVLARRRGAPPAP